MSDDFYDVLGHYILDDAHQVVRLSGPGAYERWSEWCWGDGEVERRRVAASEIGDVRISTVFLGIDHSFECGPPILFETMIFADGDADLDDEQRRYATWDEAMDGHDAACSWVRAVLAARAEGSS